MSDLYSNTNCEKMRFRTYYDAIEQATFDQYYHNDIRKVYYCWNCKSWHTSRECVNTDVGLLDR